MNQLQTFNFNGLDVRTILIDDEPYFVGKDVTEILGYKNASKALADHVDSEDIQIAEMKPKALFADSVAASDSTILIGDLAKIIKSNGFDIGARRLFQWLREKGYLISRKGSDWNSPTQKSMNLGLFVIKESIHTQPDGTVRVIKTTKVTGKGQQYFINKFLKYLKK